MFDSKIAKFFSVAVAGAVIAYFFDPRQGKTRRSKLQDQVGGMIRRSQREAGKKAEYAKGQMEGARHMGTPDASPENDQVLTSKVQSEVLGPAGISAGQINVNSADGVVELRGTCDSAEQIDRLEQEVRKLTGVVDVHNYLHMPGTPAPNK